LRQNLPLKRLLIIRMQAMMAAAILVILAAGMNGRNALLFARK
jgi:hypothetical protein